MRFRGVSGECQMHVKSQSELEIGGCETRYIYFGTTLPFALKMHKQSKHEGIKYSCEQCDYEATMKANLLRHLKSKHEEVKYPCNQCDYKATMKGSLLTHLKSFKVSS